MKHLLLVALLAGMVGTGYAEEVVFGEPPHQMIFNADGEYPTVTIGGKVWVMIPKDIWDKKNAREKAWLKEVKTRVENMKKIIKESEDRKK